MKTFTKDQAKKEIERLVKKFEKLTPAEFKKYNEANTRRDFILPLFHVLGWDVYGDFVVNEVVEEETTISGRIDYSFRINNITQFLLEAKAIPEDLDKDKWAHQAIEYGWNKGIPWVVLTDFEGLKVFNSEWKTDKPRPNLEFSFKDYLEKFDRLWLLSKESFKTNGLDKLLSEFGVVSKRANVDKKLAEDLVNWRDLLTRNLKQWDSGKHNEEDIGEAVQRILDRLIFIRVVEDRGAEEKKLWQTFQKWKSGKNSSSNFIETLIPLFRKFDDKYNSNLFEEHLCEKLYSDGEPFRKIIPQLYGEKEEGIKYRFDAIDADVLGGVYEQYLGQVQQREGETSKRKKQGIYYTPTYIVDYIVKNTIGKLLEEKTSLREKESIKILDPACGSGSFLIKAFEVIDEHLKHLRRQPVKDLAQNALRKYRVLKENIYGVDLDEQAIEIARLNLLLKALVPEQKLPLLTDHMKVGNSLIDDKKITDKAFDWQKEFPEAFKGNNPGFDVIIGNPPWVSLKGKHKSLSCSKKELDYFVNNLKVNSYAPNLYEAFIWKSLSLLNENGLFSFIVPDRFCANKQFVKLRRHILENFTLKKLYFRVSFPGIIADTVVFIVQNKKPTLDDKIEITEYPNQGFIQISPKLYLSQQDFSFYYIAPQILQIFNKFSTKLKFMPLSKVAQTTSGCGAKSSLLCKVKKSNKQIRVVKGSNIGKYQSKDYFWFDFDEKNLTGRTKDRVKLGKKEKVLLRKTGIDLIATFDDSGIYPEQSLYFIFGTDKEKLLYLLAIINSKLMNVYYQNFAVTNRASTPQLKNVHLNKFPIATGKPNSEKKLVILAKQMLGLNKKLQETSENTDRWNKLKKEIEKIEEKINQEVYKLYGLTKKEIEIVEKDGW